MSGLLRRTGAASRRRSRVPCPALARGRARSTRARWSIRDQCAAPRKTRRCCLRHYPRRRTNRGRRCDPGTMLEAYLARSVEQHVDDRPLRGRKQDLLDEPLVLVSTAVAPDKLHAGAAKREVEDTRVRRVHEVEAHYLS